MVKIYKEKAFRVIAHFSSFDPKGFDSDMTLDEKSEAWKLAVYEIFRYDMTWSMAHTIRLIDSRDSGVFIDVAVKEAYKDNLIESMKGLGFNDMTVYEITIGMIDTDDIDIDEVELAW